MQKRGILFFVLALLVFSNFGLAQENQDATQQTEASGEITGTSQETQESESAVIEEKNEEQQDETSSDLLQEAVDEYGDAELSDGGIGPGSALYFVDEVFDNFASDASLTEEKAGEVFAALESGDKEAARQALEQYEKYNKRILENADPEKREQIRRNAVAIYNKHKELSEEDKEEFSGVLEGAEEAATAVEISSKINELCNQLAELDVKTFHETCKTGEDSPEWQQEMFKDLTAEQEAEVKNFVEVIGNCFENPTDCDCEASTNIQSFVDQCNLISEAEAACREGNDEACDAADEIGENIFESLESVPHLQNALQLIERKFSEFEDDRYEDYLPPECEGLSPPECRKKMIQTHAPEECRSALENVNNEGEARKICEKIMMDKYNPECSEAGITDPRECGKFMFTQNAPPECIEAGYDGSSRDDPRKCEEIMRSLEGEFGEGPNRRGPGPGFNPDCRNIQDSTERLACYDGAISGAREHFREEGSFGFPEPCREAGAETPEACRQIMQEKFGSQEFRREGEFREGEFRGDFREGEFRPPQECEGLSPEECAQKFGGEFRGPPGEFREGQPQFGPPQGFEGQPPPSGEFREEFREGEFREGEKSSEGSSGSSESSGSSGSGESGSGGGGEEGSSGSGEAPPATGGAIVIFPDDKQIQRRSFSGFAVFSENNFLRYFYR